MASMTYCRHENTLAELEQVFGVEIPAEIVRAKVDEVVEVQEDWGDDEDED